MRRNAFVGRLVKEKRQMMVKTCTFFSDWIPLGGEFSKRWGCAALGWIYNRGIFVT